MKILLKLGVIAGIFLIFATLISSEKIVGRNQYLEILYSYAGNGIMGGIYAGAFLSLARKYKSRILKIGAWSFLIFTSLIALLSIPKLIFLTSKPSELNPLLVFPLGILSGVGLIIATRLGHDFILGLIQTALGAGIIMLGGKVRFSRITGILTVCNGGLIILHDVFYTVIRTTGLITVHTSNTIYQIFGVLPIISGIILFALELKKSSQK